MISDSWWQVYAHQWLCIKMVVIIILFKLLIVCITWGIFFTLIMREVFIEALGPRLLNSYDAPLAMPLLSLGGIIMPIGRVLRLGVSPSVKGVCLSWSSID